MIKVMYSLYKKNKEKLVLSNLCTLNLWYTYFVTHFCRLSLTQRSVWSEIAAHNPLPFKRDQKRHQLIAPSVIYLCTLA